MVSIKKWFDVVEAESLKPGDLISGFLKDVSSLGIVSSPITEQVYAVVLPDLNQDKRIYWAHVDYFGSEFVIKYNTPWSIVPKRGPYFLNRRMSDLAYRIGSITLGPNNPTIYVGRGQNMYDDIRVDLKTLQIADAHPQTGKHTVVTDWEIWLDADLDKQDAKPLYEYSAKPLGG